MHSKAATLTFNELQKKWANFLRPEVRRNHGGSFHVYVRASAERREKIGKAWQDL